MKYSKFVKKTEERIRKLKEEFDSLPKEEQIKIGIVFTLSIEKFVGEEKTEAAEISFVGGNKKVISLAKEKVLQEEKVKGVIEDFKTKYKVK